MEEKTVFTYLGPFTQESLNGFLYSGSLSALVAEREKNYESIIIGHEIDPLFH